MEKIYLRIDNFSFFSHTYFVVTNEDVERLLRKHDISFKYRGIFERIEGGKEKGRYFPALVKIPKKEEARFLHTFEEDILREICLIDPEYTKYCHDFFKKFEVEVEN